MNSIMGSRMRLIRSLRGIKPSSGPSSANYEYPAKLITDAPIEEERIPRYRPQRYYPVHIGETFHDRFLIVAKLGYGTSSTVWLAQDTRKYVSDT